ncbi:histidine kinase [Danxiaibacter flavus]|uniref:Histidine kinase n=1 Tax=Danxiaibacter flavus TaxID=3049108 RepID=A0ABV3ZKA9_9BACT|nr:histidine kinase [Chitinophagaceae bacterium DXS]
MRHRFLKYIFPPLYGLVIYFTIRLLLDSVTGMKFWERKRWGQTSTELVYCILISYIFMWVYQKLFRWFDKRWSSEFSYRRLGYELIWLLVVSLLMQNVFLTTFTAVTDDGAQWYDVVDINVVPTLYILIYYGIMRSRTYLNAYIAGKIQLEKITNDQLQTELKFLKAQYHPHFLFNALNTIYFQMDDNIGEAKKSIEKFSELLRYQLYDQQQTVAVSQEIHYLKNFIELQEVRSSDKLQLTVDFDGKLNGQQVYPLLMLPLVENAFKYVGGAYWINIKAVMNDSGFIFSVENAVPEQSQLPVQRTGGIGLENLRRRLELLYPGKHKLDVGKKDNVFKASLQIEELT